MIPNIKKRGATSVLFPCSWPLVFFALRIYGTFHNFAISSGERPEHSVIASIDIPKLFIFLASPIVASARPSARPSALPSAWPSIQPVCITLFFYLNDSISWSYACFSATDIASTRSLSRASGRPLAVASSSISPVFKNLIHSSSGVFATLLKPFTFST